MSLNPMETHYSYQKQMDKNRNSKDAILLGVGLDNDDGHKRITSAEKFSILGGSQETHDKMTETVVKTFEEIDRKGKFLGSIEPKELIELIDKNTPE